MEPVKGLVGHIKNNWGKGVFVLFSAVAFLVILFPLDDINDRISAQIAKATNNQVFVKFAHVGFNLLPHFGITLEDVSVETISIAEITADKITVSPSLMAALKQKPEGSLYLNGFLDGDLNIDVKSVGNGKIEKTKVTVEGHQLQVAKLKDALHLPGTIKSSLNINASATVDLAFKDQPEADFSILGDGLDARDITMETALGPFILPAFKFSKLTLKGRLANGQLIFENSGLEGKDMSVALPRGSLALQLINNGPGGVAPIMSTYDFDINITVQKTMEEKLSSFLYFIDKFKTAKNINEDAYAIKLSGQNFFGPPNISSLR